jgi:hypothetical protein
VSHWNVLEQSWIDASTNRGEWRRVAPLDLIRAPQEFRAIAASSPLDEFATLRFLTTLLYWKAESAGGIACLRAALLRGEMPVAVFDAIAAERKQFDLFHAERPFLQDSSVSLKPDKPVGSLFAEIATGTNIAHFDHSRDMSSPLCVTCVVRGLLRLVPWSQSGGAGLTPSIHGAPPIALIPRGGSLSESLAGCLVDSSRPLGTPTWTGSFRPSRPNAPVPLLEALTWNPRRVRIAAPTMEDQCRLCGTFGPVIGAISFKKNEAVKKPDGDDKKPKPFNWRDPAFVYREGKADPLRSGDERAAALSRDLKWLPDPMRPEDLARSWCVVIPCTNPANNKSYDHRRIEVPAGADVRAMQVEHHGANGLELVGHPLDRREVTHGSVAVRAAVERFIRLSCGALDESGWLALRRSIGLPMHADPEAFAVFSAVYWRCRSAGRSALRRDAAWTLIKLLALAPTWSRSSTCNRILGDLLDSLPVRQASRRRSEAGSKSPYPIAQPRGLRLEREIAAIVAAEVAAKRCIPWLELGIYLNTMAR